jgi:hypothetical protein
MTHFDPTVYGPVFAELLREPRLFPLDAGKPYLAMRPQLNTLHSDTVFQPHTVRDHNMANACRAGVWLYHEFLDEAHTISQDVHTPEGSYWHALVHRREPDFDNSKYWFRQVGAHPIFANLAEVAAELGYGNAARWDPFVFVDACERAIRTGAEEELCKRVQRVEWELLFAWCYEHAVGA